MVAAACTPATVAPSWVASYATDSKTSDPVRPVFLTFDGEGEEGRPFAHMVPNTAMGVVQNIAMVRTAGRGVVAAYPAGLAPPAVTNVVATGAGQIRSTGAFTRLGGGAERFRTSVATDLVVDVTGWFRGG